MSTGEELEAKQGGDWDWTRESERSYPDSHRAFCPAHGNSYHNYWLSWDVNNVEIHFEKK